MTSLINLLSIPGDNGTIDGQGQTWWDKFHSKELSFTRGYLIEIMYSNQVLISNITLVDSPSWNLHPVYSRSLIILFPGFRFSKQTERSTQTCIFLLRSDVIVSAVTILAPVNSPNTDGINPGIFSCFYSEVV